MYRPTRIENFSHLKIPPDILEAGIEIIARPPGKEPRSISLLSGGERTMSIADMLFGVTMQTQGVSKKISVRFDEYEPDNAAVA